MSEASAGRKALSVAEPKGGGIARPSTTPQGRKAHAKPSQPDT